ncbi:hydrogenase expression/formation protein HypE [Clostridium pasteurianum DSM 525 = ATCC 6013]|uniref:Hydrogenase expression/formation protein HypE n=1 Tax=Clostridium pasteurianum DSM 525 = ATCC 6013 TaxID=1262449 RepID=A0A0H3J757_CLOPA|nr:hydrogenase expression/formation protein HypE [Clostridium pasteurianum]AJA46815.1 hydrogenase expression/formation protein HypE [Clostridium pasteurianum DSM 525 = ATCC 6013]AJA50803.1 hydrogenase expression/formation protein HypE [Clostridium pasteurianum DSM 525 = ATCC 6013]AOZ74209.1 hydrogenase expression/formation protein HypE [Clostridium pasteurianum DSM 525 = ATCC 6013]AOZ78007.1 hydrogenase expression/formation protein HypE [Clostridium pasteurianum]ELP58574.1 Hydrogenase formatio
MEDKISLSHGSGGKQTNDLISNLFIKYFDNEIIRQMNDSAQLYLNNNRIAFTTDSFVVTPAFFKGGDIGKLAVCGTVNDLAMSGAKPLYLTSAFIIEEGYPIENLETIVKSMAEMAERAGVKIVAGDTKVVEKGGVDGLFINTSGIGTIYEGINIEANKAEAGDVVIVNGTLGDHGMTIMCERSGIDIQGELKSDCAPLNSLVDSILDICKDVHVLRDATRGGVAAVLNEIAETSRVSIELEEDSIPISEEVKGACELLGLDPLYIANEGKLCCFVPEKYAHKVLEQMRNHPLGTKAEIIGKVVAEVSQRVYLKTIIGGRRIVDMPSGQQLPRIC